MGLGGDQVWRDALCHPVPDLPHEGLALGHDRQPALLQVLVVAVHERRAVYLVRLELRGKPR